jgi:hypothetical protein
MTTTDRAVFRWVAGHDHALGCVPALPTTVRIERGALEGHPQLMSLSLITLCCPVCNNHFRSQSVAPALLTVAEGKYTDFRESVDTPLLAYSIHPCPRCN